MMTLGMDKILLEDGQVVFISAVGNKVNLPNLTKLVAWCEEEKDSEIGVRIKQILEGSIEQLLISEVMIDMNSEKTRERLCSGEISKTMGHVDTYSIILDSHMAVARKQFEEELKNNAVTGNFEDCFFAQFPYGMVIVKELFKDYKNTNYSIEIL